MIQLKRFSFHSSIILLSTLIVLLSFSPCVVIAQSGKLMPFTAAEKQEILDIHNSLRAACNAKAMPKLVWMDSLALWESNPKNCEFAHTTQEFRSNKAGFGYVGENLAWAGGQMSVGDLIGGWGDEKSMYIYGPINYATISATGHYTQQVWSETTAIGCARYDCRNANSGGYIVACHYGPGGNWGGQYPYQLCDTGNCGAQEPSRAAPSPPPSQSSTSAPSQSRSSAPSASSTSRPSSTSSASIAPSSTSSASRSISSSASTSLSASKSAAATPSSSPIPTCIPTTCAANSCGTKADGCGAALNCGRCSSATDKCVNNTCIACIPTTTCDSKQCGTINDGCGNTISCGSCSSGETCEGYQCKSTVQCKTCAELGLTCGSVTAEPSCPILSCGNCLEGVTECAYGKCIPVSCPLNCSEDVNSECVGGVCRCLQGYSDKSDGNGCTPITQVPTDFSEIPFAFSKSNWIVESDPQTRSPLMAMVSSDQLVHKLEWHNAEEYSSPELTKLSSDVRATADASVVGLGLRLGQGEGRELDAIQWKLELVPSTTNNKSVNVRWIVVWQGEDIDYSVRGKDTWATGSWHNIQMQVTESVFGTTKYVLSQMFIDNNAVTRQQATRPYDNLGGAYLYTEGMSAWKNIMLATATTLRVSTAGCLSEEQWRALVAKTLGISESGITMRNVSDPSGTCIGQSTKKRQGAVIGTEFVFTLHSNPGASSQSLASKFTQLAKSMNPSLAESGGVKSVSNVAPELANPDVSYESIHNMETETPAVAEGAATGGGLSGGAIAGIVIGSVVGGALLIALIAAAVVGGIVLFNKHVHHKFRRDTTTADDVELPSQSYTGSPKIRPRGGVDIYEHDPQQHESITARLPGAASSSNMNV